VCSSCSVAWNDEKPIDRWDEIHVLLERLAPDKALVPSDAALRIQMFGISYEICGPLGIGWNARLAVFRPLMESGAAPEAIAIMAAKWGYRESDVAQAEARVIASLHLLADVLKTQRSRGSAYFVGDSLTAVDFYWTAFSALVKPMSPEVVHLIPAAQALFDNIPPAVDAAVDPVLLEHRDRIMQAHFAVPMEM
jgi:glutathione S-transferase